MNFKVVQQSLAVLLLLLVGLSLSVSVGGLIEYFIPQHIYVYDAKRSLLILVSSFAFVLSFSLSQIQSLKLHQKVLILLLCVLVFLSSINSTDWIKSTAISSSFILFLLACYSYSFKLTQSKEGIIALSIGIGIIVYSFIFIVLLTALLSLQLPVGNKQNIFHGFTNPRFLNHLQTLFVPLVPLFLNYCRPKVVSIGLFKIVRAIIFISICIYISLIFFTSARGSLWSIIIAIAVSVFLFKSDALSLFKQLVFPVLIAMVFFILLHYIYPLLVDIESSKYTLARGGLTHRELLWTEALKQFFASPLLGVGAGMYQAAGTTANHPHNIILWLLSEFGLGVTIILGWMICQFIVSYAQGIRSSSSQVDKYKSIALFTASLAIIIHSMVSGTYIKPTTLLVLLPFIAVIMRDKRKLSLLTSKQKVTNEEQRKGGEQLKNGVLSATIAMLLLMTIYPYYQRVVAQQEHIRQLLSEDQFYLVEDYSAFFWLDGSL